MSVGPTTEDRIAALEQRASTTSDSIGGLRSQMIEILARVGRVEGAVGEIREDVESMAGSLREVRQAVEQVRADGAVRAAVAHEQAERQEAAIARLIGTIEKLALGRQETGRAVALDDGATRRTLYLQIAAIIGAIGTLGGLVAAVAAALSR